MHHVYAHTTHRCHCCSSTNLPPLHTANHLLTATPATIAPPPPTRSHAPSGALAVTSQLIFLCSFVWLSHWSSVTMSRARGNCDNNTPCDSNTTLLTIYLVITCAAAAASIANRCVWAMVGLRAATRLHECMLMRVLYSTQAAVEAIPIGQFLSRFGADVDVLDSKVWVFSAVAAASFLDMCMKVALLVAVIPASGIAFAVLVFLYNRVQQKCAPMCIPLYQCCRCASRAAAAAGTCLHPSCCVAQTLQPRPKCTQPCSPYVFL